MLAHIEVEKESNPHFKPNETWLKWINANLVIDFTPLAEEQLSEEILKKIKESIEVENYWKLFEKVLTFILKKAKRLLTEIRKR